MPYISAEKIANPDEQKIVGEILEKMESQNRKAFWVKKRAIDIFMATVFLLFFFIPMFIIGLIIFIGDPSSSPIFCQDRVGRHGRIFKLYKFRTMITGADKMLDTLIDKNESSGPTFKIKDDPRITKFGKFLRRTSLDELPQFFNVLKGDMTVVGPRPALPREVAQYTEFQKLRLTVSPGITCIWQIQPKRNDLTFDQWMNLDVEYILHRSTWMDIKIMFNTALVMMRGEGR